MRMRLNYNFVYKISTQFKKNPYEVLGVTREATQNEIKTAYYRLAKVYHPDLKPDFAQKFKEISEAYKILKDASKRAEFESLHDKVKHRDDIKQVKKSYYNTVFHYGYTSRYSKDGSKASTFENNPFADSQSQQSPFSNSFTRDIFARQSEQRRRTNLSQMNKGVKYVLMGILGFIGVTLAAEMMLNVYKFNHYNQKEVQIQGRGRSKMI